MGLVVVGALVLAFVATAANLLWRQPDARIKRQLRKVPSASISTLAEGAFARVVGNAHLAGEPLIAPLSGRPCAYYSVVVEKSDAMRGTQYWVPVISERRAVPFVLGDGTGYVTVDATDAEALLRRSMPVTW